MNVELKDVGEKDVLCMFAVILLISIPESLSTVVLYKRKVRDIYKKIGAILAQVTTAKIKK